MQCTRMYTADFPGQNNVTTPTPAYTHIYVILCILLLLREEAQLPQHAYVHAAWRAFFRNCRTHRL